MKDIYAFFRESMVDLQVGVSKMNPGKVEDLCQISDGSWIKQELYAVSWIIWMPDAYILRFDVENTSPDYWAVFVGYIHVYIYIVWLSLSDRQISSNILPLSTHLSSPMFSSWIGRRLQNLNLHLFGLVVDTQQVSWKWHWGGIRRQQLEFTGICDTSKKNTRRSTGSRALRHEGGDFLQILLDWWYFSLVCFCQLEIIEMKTENPNLDLFLSPVFWMCSADKRFLYWVFRLHPTNWRQQNLPASFTFQSTNQQL